MFSAKLIRHLFRQDRATMFLEGIAVATVQIDPPARNRRLFGRA